MITFKCPSCGTSLEVPDELAGKAERCPSCGADAQVPAAPPPKREGLDGADGAAAGPNAGGDDGDYVCGAAVLWGVLCVAALVAGVVVFRMILGGNMGLAESAQVAAACQAAILASLWAWWFGRASAKALRKAEARAEGRHPPPAGDE